VWVDVDVGAKRKGFDVAVTEDRRVLALQGHLTCRQAVDMVMANRPAVVAIDSPRSCAPEGQSARDGELQLPSRSAAPAGRPTQDVFRRARTTPGFSRDMLSSMRWLSAVSRSSRSSRLLMDSLAWQARPADPRGLDSAGIGSPRSAVRARAHELRPARRSCRCDDRSSAQSGPDRKRWEIWSFRPTAGDVRVPGRFW
jgi:hypothetical protein